MKNALISPLEQVSYISGWTLVGKYYEPVLTVVGERVAEVADQTFEVAAPLFWVDCADDVNAMDYYYDPVSANIKKTPDPVPMPPQPQPSVDGAQTL